MVKIGIIGCGTIGAALAKAIEENFCGKAELVALCDIDRNKAQALSRSLMARPSVVEEDVLIKLSDLVIEAASARVSAGIAKKTVLAAKDAMIMSVGGLLEDREVFGLAEQKKTRIYLPSGAICGLDGIKAAAVGRVKKVCLTTRKPPKGFEGAPYLIKNKVDLARIEKETVLFEGAAREAVLGFPKNVNVAAVLSLAGIGADRTIVRIITSPHYKTNSHEVEVEGEFGRLSTKTDNLPSPDNPKTSFLAILSAIATLRSILDAVKIGT